MERRVEVVKLHEIVERTPASAGEDAGRVVTRVYQFRRKPGNATAVGGGGAAERELR